MTVGGTPAIKALEKTAFDQGLTPRRMTMNELFADPAQSPVPNDRSDRLNLADKTPCL